MIKEYPHEMLYEWDLAADRFSAGCPVEAENWELNKGNSQWQLKLKTIQRLCFLWFEFNPSLGKLTSMWAGLYALIMGIAMPIMKLADQNTV